MIRFLTTRLVAVAWLGVWAGPLACGADDEALVTFDQVRPVLRKHCGACHNPARPRGEFDVSTVASIKVGSTSGPTAIPGKPDESTLYLLPAHLEEPKMPPNRPRIPARELELIRRWIEGGLKEKTGTVVRAPAPAAKPSPVAARADANRPQSEIVGSGAVPRPAEGVRVEPWPRRSAITALAFSPVSPWWAIAGKRQVLIYRWPDRKPLTALAFPEGDIFSLRFSRDGRWLLAGGGVGATSGTVVGFEVASGRRAFAVGDASDAVLACDISPDGKLVALGGPDRTIAVHRVSDGQLVATLRKHTDWILGLAFSPDGVLLASGDRFGGLQV
ncbi:MAG: c-type cytochrome domain-containing protein, partial [Pirellulaceae bacterium]